MKKKILKSSYKKGQYAPKRWEFLVDNGNLPYHSKRKLLAILQLQTFLPVLEVKPSEFLDYLEEKHLIMKTLSRETRIKLAIKQVVDQDRNELINDIKVGHEKIQQVVEEYYRLRQKVLNERFRQPLLYHSLSF